MVEFAQNLFRAVSVMNIYSLTVIPNNRPISTMAIFLTISGYVSSACIAAIITLL